MKANLFATVLALGLVSVPAQAATWQIPYGNFTMSLQGEFTGPVQAFFEYSTNYDAVAIDPNVGYRFPPQSNMTVNFLDPDTGSNIGSRLLFANDHTAGCTGSVSFCPARSFHNEFELTILSPLMVWSTLNFSVTRNQLSTMYLMLPDSLTPSVGTLVPGMVIVPGPLAGAGLLPLLGFLVWVRLRRTL